MKDTIQESQSGVRMAVFILFIEKVRGVLRFKLFSSFIISSLLQSLMFYIKLN